MSLASAIFLDRDGVLNELVVNPVTQEHEAPQKPKDVALLPGIANAIKQLRMSGYTLVVFSNQPDVAKGKCTLQDLSNAHDAIVAALGAEEIRLDDFYYCYHHPKGIVPQWTGPCECRKPAPGMILKAAQKHNLDLKSSWVVGDRDIDAEAGVAAGCRSILVNYPFTSKQRKNPSSFPIVADLSAAAGYILSRTKSCS
jgi:D-glycero-D-manno-heptose 1,7-bisphosphate phosphatase